MQILSVIVIIGILIFVHELGHFLAAKSLNIPVKIFSIGFPLGNLPPIVNFKWGETECQLNWLPLGGFCAFLDDVNDTSDVGLVSSKKIDKEEIADESQLLNNRKVWERFVVISGGVVGNLIFAFFVAVVMFYSMGIPEGREFNDSVLILDVQAGSPAAKAGIKTLDEVIKVDDNELTFEHDLKQTMNSFLKTDEDKVANIGFFDVETGETVNKDIKIDENGNINAETEEVSGINVSQLISGSNAEEAGIEKNDIIVEIAGKGFSGVRNPEGLLKSTLKENSNNPVTLKVLRDGNYKEFTLTPDSDGKLGIGIEYIKGLLVKSVTNKNSNIRENDIIISINEMYLNDTASIMKHIVSTHKKGTPAKVVVKRQEQILNFDVIPNEEGLLGVQIHQGSKEIYRKPNSLFEPVTASFSYISRMTIVLSDALLKLFTGNLSLNQVGGPIMVVAKGSEIAQADYSKLFQFTILISIELVILNLLPLPAVDGGHLFLLIIEKIRGKRLPKHFEERIHYAGLLVLLGLGIVLIFKDIFTLAQ